MSEYIDREALLAHIKDLPTWWADAGGVYGRSMKYPEGMFDCEDVVSSVENAPAADVAPVRNGRWIALTDCSNVGVYCSVCQKKVYKEDYAWCNRKNKIRSLYCPNCGARMDGGTENGTAL